MSFQIKEIRDYFKRNRHYIPQLLNDICKLLWWKLCWKRIVVITTGSGGVGDYLWIRNYIPLLKEKGYKTILIAMAHWKEIVVAFDKNNVDTVRYFESCLSPKKIESCFFKLFKADAFLNFRANCIAEFVKSKQTYSDNKSINDICFYEEKNNDIFQLFQPLPSGFKHQLPIIEPPQEKKDVLNHPFVVLVEGGNTQGKLSDSQLYSIAKHLIDKGYNILFNGDYIRICNLVDSAMCSKIIDGSLFTFPQYTYIISEASFIVTVNTSIYHFAVQLNKPIVAISCNEHHTLQRYKDNQQLVFNNKLQSAYNNHTLSTYTTDYSVTLVDIDIESILKAIDNVQSH